MTLEELKAIEPRAHAYELRQGGKYLLCLQEKMSKQHIETIQEMLTHLSYQHGIQFVGILDFVPRIFELEPEKEQGS